MIPSSNPGPDPYETLAAWYKEACDTEPRVPDAMQLATADEHGRPSLRTVLLKAFGHDQGFVFFTNYTSRKAGQLDRNPHAAVCLHWKDIARQVIAEGTIQRLDRAASEAYFASRSRGSQIGAWASAQSSALGEREELVARVRAYQEQFDGKDVPCPPHWGGYRLSPHRIEFWQDVESRLHHRVLFTRDGDSWRRSLLQP